MDAKYNSAFREDDTGLHLRDESVLSADGVVPKEEQGLKDGQELDLKTMSKHRKVVFGKPVDPSIVFLPNSIRTSRYTLLTWAPKSLLWQFRKSANIYFLVISILTMMSFSPKSPFSMAGTFAAVLVFTMIKEAYEDYFRHMQDRKVNSTMTHCYDVTKKDFKDITWKDVKVGDILEIRDGESFPADMVFLSSSNLQGTAFVNTMNLDGETNLKEKMALEFTKDMRELDLPAILIEVATDEPNLSLVKWNCNISMNGSQWQPMTMNQLLLRGCQLRNTRRLYGLVIYTGQESKIMLNSKEARSKMSNVLKRMNKMLYTVYAMQFCICVSFAGLSVYWQSVFVDTHLYLNITDSPNPSIFIIQVLTFYVAYSHLIPISLYVALEIVKIACSYLLGQDLQMYNEADDRPATARTSDLVEELGQVEFVFSDKTGTLTQNIMKFKKCSINGVIYGNDVGIGKAAGQDSRISEILANRHAGDAEKTAIVKFLIHMSLCHTVFPTETHEKNKIPSYQASSPDELALVEGAAMLGFVFQDKTMNTLFTRTAGSNEKLAWEILAEIPFNSNRKRMSLILKEPSSNRIILLCKGADQVMFPLLREDQALRHIVEDHLHHFAIEGLRTLVMCQKELEEIDFKRWHKQWKELQLSNSVDKEAQLDKLGATIENKLELLGASAIEDKLQDGVPDTIALLIAAGIRVWVLTGDKQETAVEIGKSCNLIKSSMRLLDFSSSTQAELLSKIETYTSELVSSTQGAVGKSLYQLARIKESLKQKIAIVIDGVSLLWAIENSLETRQLFFKLGYLSNSCICCRVSPAQKMQIVQLAKENGTWITLAVGDGANDVSMIQEAHIGVGIAGKEGTQAVQSADYSISQFRYLQRLLLVHGRWGYRRISWFICYYFYKNIAVVFTELCFAFMNGLSGQIYFLDWLPMLYNALWTSWPCMFTFIFEQDLRDTEALEHPSTYQAGQRRLYFTFKTFWTWVGTSMWHGLICFWLPFQGLGFAVNGKGWDTGLWWVSTVSFTMVIHVITIKLFVESIYWNKVNT